MLTFFFATFNYQGEHSGVPQLPAFDFILQDFKIAIWEDTQAKNLLPRVIFYFLKNSVKID